jgi:hypothetical protein
VPHGDGRRCHRIRTAHRLPRRRAIVFRHVRRADALQRRLARLPEIGAAISGGLTPFVAATFMVWTGGAMWPISVHLIVLAAITFIATTMAPETAGKPLR